MSVVRPFGFFIFFKGMPFKLHIYLEAFVTYCDPILVSYNYYNYCFSSVLLNVVLFELSAQWSLCIHLPIYQVNYFMTPTIWAVLWGIGNTIT